MTDGTNANARMQLSLLLFLLFLLLILLLFLLLLLPLLQGLPHRLHDLGDALKRRVWLLLLDRILRLLEIIGCA